MKKLVAFLLLLLLVSTVRAQVSGTTQSIGFTSANTTVMIDGVEYRFGTMGGLVVGTNNVEVLEDGQNTSQSFSLSGFPYPIQYFPLILSDNFFVSKGYFPDFIQLRWDVIPNVNNISQFQIFRKPLGQEGDSLLIATVGKDVYSFQDETAELGTVYQYTVFARGIADDLRIQYVNYIQEEGFAFPAGSVTGKIAYEGGTTVEGVTVLATTNGNLRGKAVDLSGENGYLRIDHNSSDTELELREGFTIQMWVRYDDDDMAALFSKGDDYGLTYDGSRFIFKVGDASLQMEMENPVDTFFHVAASYSPGDELRLISYIDDDRKFEQTTVAGSQPSANTEFLIFGLNSSNDYLRGALDEIRVWQRVLTAEEVDNNYNRYIVGNEQKLSAYYRFDQGITNKFYDFAKRGATYLENHGELVNAVFFTETPLQSQLSFRGITDEFGNYSITGFPYETSGSLYNFTPLLPFHTFEPGQQVRFVGPGVPIHNEVDFTDNSSFKVSGTVKYEGGPFPVQGVNLLVDGQPATNADGKLITTDAQGRFTIDVPIGRHSVTAFLNNHDFENGGRFPAATEENEFPTYDFQGPLNGLEFVDQTKIKLVGKVVGGPVEAEKLLGFSQSKNNIGNATIQLTTKKSLDLVDADKTENVNEFNAGEEVNTRADFSTRNVTVYPDEETGEFVVYLPPEEYQVTSVSAGTNIFDDSFKVGIDLRNAFNQTDEILKDTVEIATGGSPIPGYAEFSNDDDYDSIILSTFQDTLFTIAVDTFKFQKRQDFIFRVAPTISVKNLSNGDVFGEEEIRYIDENLGIDETIAAYNSEGDYTFGHPIFLQRANYQMVIELFEQYENSDSNEQDQVPVVDGKIEITNNFAVNDNLVSLELNDQGRAIYSFLGGLPNIDLDFITPANSFTKTLNITAVSGNNGAIRTQYRQTDPFRGIVFGGLPTGNNFVTTGPNKIDMILRDPPGSGSYAYLEEGATISNTESYSLEDSEGASLGYNYQLGFTLETAIGLGAEVTTEVEVENSVSEGLSTSSTFNSNEEVTNTMTTTQTISTDAEDFVGSDGDLFIGRATNIVYGLSNFINLVPTDQCELCGDTESSGYKIGKNTGLRINPEFKTTFIFSQWSLENQVIPNLKNIRNSFLVYAEDPNTINPIGEPVYVSKIPPTDNRFGSSNTDKAVWGDLASEFVNEGESYIIRYPDGYDTDDVSDTVFFYNQQIDDWEFWLAENERQKLEAKLIENVSFSSGSSLERSVETTSETTVTTGYEFNLSREVSTEIGASVNDFGFSVSTNLSRSVTIGKESVTSEAQTTTYGFVLADGDLGDTYTIDLMEPKDGFGTVFKTRGGATSCPYEDEEVTRYYQPGELLNVATAQREKPVLTSNQSEVSGVPQNRAANFTLNLSNISDTNEGFQFEVDVLDGSNPSGAQLSIDGAPLGNGLIFQVVPGQSLTKTLSIRQGQDDVFDYENIGIMLRSLCQSDPNDNLPEIADTVRVSAFFVPGCSDISLSSPGNNWVVNTNAPKEDTLMVRIDSYDLNVDNFRRIQFQYRPAGSSDFLTDMTFYNQQQVTLQEFDEAPEPKMFVNESSILYPFDMSSLPDQQYDIRVVALCDAGPGVTYETPSDVLRGTKDTRRPQLFGAPQPADGILSANDQISIRFNETISSGILTNSNFSVRGVLNNTPVNNSISLDMDGQNDYVRIQNGVDLGGSFTIEFKMKRQSLGQEMVIFSKGFVNTDKLEIGLTDDNKLFIDINGERKVTTVTLTNQTNYNHYAVTYDAANDEFYAYENSRFIFERLSFTDEFSGDGPIAIGKSTTDNDRFLNANVLDLRIWDKFRPITDVFAGISTVLRGTEVGLIGYWPFNEGFGDIALDKARFRNASVFSDWQVLPEGKSISFDGIQDYLTINTSSTVVISEETDFTIEFWYKGAEDQASVVMFSSGKGTSGSEAENIADDPSKSLSIGFNQNGRLYVASNGQVSVVNLDSEDVLDDDWHHFALSVSRLGNGSVFLDGEQVSSISNDNFGSIIRAMMTLGARGYNSGSNTVVYDQNFEGLIDEFRIWNSSLNNTQIQLNNDSRLKGNELGLVAYYPFDDFVTVSGIQQLTESLNDKFQNPFGSNGGSATNNGAEFSDVTPNIKLSRPVQTVPFDFVVNDDEIVIDLSSSTASAIEGTILEITVDKIEDLFENRLASSISFTAFIDRNQVIWDQNSFEIEQDLGEETEFSVEILNLGGSEERFELINIPPWLKASPSEGSISPQSRTRITFTVNSGLNNGYYNEDIFLTTDFGFNEKLNLDLKVLEPAPPWEVNPSDFEFSMGIVATLNVNGIISRDENDLIAAFVDDEIRGVAHLEYIEQFDEYIAFMDIYSDVANGTSPIEFRAYDADEGVEYRDLDPIEPNFESNSTIGRPSNPQQLSTGPLRSETYNFAAGFNWVSFNLNSSMLDSSNDLLADVQAETNDRVLSPDALDVYTDGLGWIGTLTNSGGYRTDTYYLFSLKNGGSIDLVGTKVDADERLTINPGFNRISFIPDFNLTVNEAFSSVGPSDGDIVRGQFAFAIFEEGLGWIGSLKNLEPGRGYLYYSNAEGEKGLIYPSNTLLANEKSPDESLDSSSELFEYENPWWADLHAYPLNMSVVAQLDTELPEGYVVAAFNSQQQLVGWSEPLEVNGRTLFYLSVHGFAEDDILSYQVFDRKSGEYYQVIEKTPYEVNSLEGSFDEPLILSIDEKLNVEKSSIALPNPFTDRLEIQLANPVNQLTYEITDINGMPVFDQQLSSDLKIRSIIWEGDDETGNDVPTGVYVIKIVTNGGVEILKVLKQD